MDTAIVVDLDGTLALFDREQVSPYRRDFLADVPNAPVVKLTQAMAAAGHKIVVLSGRTVEFHTDTVDWLMYAKVPFTEIHMRPLKDNRPDTELKKELFFTYVAPKYNTLFVVDDRPKVVRLWRQLGVPVFDVGDGVEF